ncbi:MAG: hypothetical protein EOP04_19070, partial [Proteobacteria bacterium]
MFFTFSLRADEFPNERLAVDQNIWVSNEFVNQDKGRDIVIRRLPKNSSACTNPDNCPPVIVIDSETGNTN